MPKAGRQPLKWHGGKAYCAPWIISRMPPHLNYVEPYFGGGAVLFARDPGDRGLWLPPHRGVSEVVCDLNGELTNFWNVLACEVQFPRFLRIAQATPFSEGLWGGSGGALGGDCCDDEAARAAYFFVLNRQSLAGRMKNFTGVTKTRLRSGMNNEVSAWLSAVEGLPAVHERLKRVLILKPQPALRVIDRFDLPETLFYLDPPYVHESRATTGEYGAFEMSGAEHEGLLGRLSRCKAKWMLSGYRNAVYDRFFAGFPHTLHTFEVPNQASGAKVKERKTECLWCNF
jgi:DNA adenine methylase